MEYLYIYPCIHTIHYINTEITKQLTDMLLQITAERVALPFVVKQLNDLQVPKVSGDVKTPLGNVNFNLHK